MGLDLAATIAQIDSLARRLHDGTGDRARRFDGALTAMREADPAEVRQEADAGQARPFMCATPVDGFSGTYRAENIPDDFCVVSVDGSHIDVDRHTPPRCYLINVGGCLLTYGSEPDAQLFSSPRLYAEDDELYMTSPAPGSRDSVAVQGPVLGLKRTVEEIRGLVSAVERVSPELPVLGLIDGSLVLWGLAGQGYQPFVRDTILNGGLIPALDRLRELARSRTLAVAAYISFPQSAEVVNTLRSYLCPGDADECRQHCSIHRSSRTPCDLVNGFLDRHLFGELLAPGERSDLYQSNSSISRDFYGPHRAHFYYLNTGEEIGRVELPEWVARDDSLLALSHALILDQCRRGLGYPAAVAEAHEQAVITGQDRESFRQLVEGALMRQRIPVQTSEKVRSKRMRSL